MGDFNNQTEPRLLNISQTAKILQVAPHTIRVWFSKDVVIPKSLIIKLGGRTLIHKQKLYEWINNGCKPEINNRKVGE